MELNDLALRFIPGFTVNVEERAALETQMALRQSQERLSVMKFWGRVTGTTGDYLVVFGEAGRGRAGAAAGPRLAAARGRRRAPPLAPPPSSHPTWPALF